MTTDMLPAHLRVTERPAEVNQLPEGASFLGPDEAKLTAFVSHYLGTLIVANHKEEKIPRGVSIEEWMSRPSPWDELSIMLLGQSGHDHLAKVVLVMGPHILLTDYVRLNEDEAANYWLLVWDRYDPASDVAHISFERSAPTDSSAERQQTLLALQLLLDYVEGNDED